jgi:gliding motility-associated-like protein
MHKQVAIIVFFFLFTKISFAQSCSNIGQTPSSAFPVCGTTAFGQLTVPICGNTNIPVPCNDGASYQDKNPYWYKFTCYTAGTLGFIITPNNLNDDYDWQLFDVTGQNPNNVFTDASLFVACNWSGFFGVTGATSAGTSLISCAGNNPIFSSMPPLIVNHDYLLLVSHYTNSQSGYQLQFSGGTAGITDPQEPHLLSATINCAANTLTVKLNKKMKCTSLAANGSDFTVSGAATVISATAPSCTGGFDTDSIILVLNTPLAAGNYNLIMQNGADGNTLLDNCGRNIPVGESTPFNVSPTQPAAMDSLKPFACSPSILQLVFRKPIICSSVAANGSDFAITGPQAVTISGANNNCGPSTTTTMISLQLSSPIVVGGTYQVQLNIGSDGNTIIDECGVQTPAGATLLFTATDTVSAAFSYTMKTGCRSDTLQFSHNGANAVSSWAWTFDNPSTSSLQNPAPQIYSASSQHSVKLVVSNGVCTDSVTQTIVLDNQVIAAFETNNIICPEDSATFINKSTGNIDGWQWVFGNGNTSNLQDPLPQKYPAAGMEKKYNVKLIAANNALGCKDSISHTIIVLGNCFIAVPSAFTPNADGLNDYLYPLNAVKADNLDFKVFNRWGQLVFETKNWLKKWDGSVKGIAEPSGVYVWFLRFTHHDTGKNFFMKGTTMLIR